MCAHGVKARIDDATFAFLDLVHRRLHVVKDAAPGDSAQRCKRAGVRVKQHFMALAWVAHQPEGPAGAQLEVRYLHLVVNAAHHHALFAPVKLERLAQFKAQRHKCFERLALLAAPLAYEGSELAIATGVAPCLNLNQQGFGGTPVLLDAVRVGFECLLDFSLVGRQLGWHVLAHVLQYVLCLGRSNPLADRVSRQARVLGNLVQRLLVPKVQAFDFS